MTVWRVAIVGYGEWGPNHVRNFSAVPNARVVAVVDSRPERRARAAGIVPGVPVFERVAEMLAAVRPEVVVVATPTATHDALVREALEAGAHVLCEKPLCVKTEDAD